MIITAQKSQLLAAMLPCLKAVARSSVNTVLENFLLSAQNDPSGTLTVTGYDMEKGVKCVLPAIVKEEGKILVSSSKLSAIINNLPEGEINISSDDRLKVKITAGNSLFEIAGVSADLFPTLPILRGDKRFGISHALLKHMTRQTSFAASNIDTKPFLTGLYFVLSGDTIKIAGCDGFRLALREEKLDGDLPENEMAFIVPAKTMINLSDILDDDDQKRVDIQLSNKHIIFITDDFIFFSRLIEGSYLDYERAFPKDPAIFITADLEKLVESINRVALIVDQRAKSPVKCYVAPGLLKMVCISSNGSINEEIDAKTEGKEIDLEIGFNHIFLKDAFEKAKDCGEEQVIIEMTSSLTGIMIRPLEGQRFLYFIQPVRLQ